VKLISSGQLDVAAVRIAANHDPPRIQIRFGQIVLTLSELEAVSLAARLVDVIAQLRADQPDHREEPTP
jgi:hypothetical protein